MLAVLHFSEFVAYVVYAYCAVIFSRLHFLYAFKATDNEIDPFFEFVAGILIVCCANSFFASQHTMSECVLFYTVLTLSVFVSYSDWHRHIVVADILYITLIALVYFQSFYGARQYVRDSLCIFLILSLFSFLSYYLLKEFFIGFADVLYIVILGLCFGWQFVALVISFSAYIVLSQYIVICLKKKEIVKKFEFAYLPILSFSALFFYALLDATTFFEVVQLFL